MYPRTEVREVKKDITGNRYEYRTISTSTSPDRVSRRKMESGVAVEVGNAYQQSDLVNLT